MCGISGFAGKDETLIRKMNEVNKYRGPDDAGVYLDDFVSLGHTRLSIIDLSSNGHQPMEYGNLVITYNGEIYNHREIREDLIKKDYTFTSDCDTEVVLKAYDAYGTDCFNMFDGMWAFCIYDKEKQILILSRDLFGIKPLYYYSGEGKFIFSSMIDAVLCHKIDTKPNNKIIMDFLSFNLINHTNETFCENINCLEQGCFMIYNLAEKTCEIKRWYSQKDLADLSKTAGNECFEDSEKEVTSRLRELFDKSVRNRTLADVKIGSCLSGGVDSSSIVCILDKHLDEKFPTFSLVVPGFKKDESEYIKEVGRKTNTAGYTVEMTPDAFLEHVEDFIECQEEPVTGVSPFCQYMVMKLVAEHDIKVILDGQGGDELFAGYDYYYANYFADLFSSLRFAKLISVMAKYYKHRKSFYPHALFAYQMMSMPIKRAFCYKKIVPWVNKSYHTSVAKKPHDTRWKKRSLRGVLDLTMRETAIPHLLRFEDKNSMRWSIESRPPFLDKDLYEYSRAIPDELMIHDGETKYCFRRAMKDILPEKIFARTDKIGFAAPSDNLFRDESVIAFADSIIYSDAFKQRPYWNYERVVEMYEKHKAGKINIGDIIWKWINLSIWLDNFEEKRKGCV